MYFTYIPSPVGPIFLAGEQHRVARLSFTTGHQVRFPEPEWIQDEDALRPAVEQLQQYFAGERKAFTLEPALAGTEFQQMVWRALMSVPFGQTRSYGDVADSIGRPGSARAVGAANAANYLPLLVPCHRIVGSHGSLTGFGGGLETKRWLLDFERRHADRRPGDQLSLLAPRTARA